jgi:hypothetical protein
VDTYLAVWVSDYVKGPNLCDHFVSPPEAAPKEPEAAPKEAAEAMARSSS